MSPKEALAMLDRVSQQPAMNRADHMNCIQAVQVIAATIDDRERLLLERKEAAKKEATEAK